MMACGEHFIDVLFESLIKGAETKHDIVDTISFGPLLYAIEQYGYF